MLVWWMRLSGDNLCKSIWWKEEYILYLYIEIMG